ncbi:hypothetical protein GCM10010387_33060 [Streptomyces inusitatus]|uniref:Ricin B lectin domain-containing protein n=1 Tax=Streptomyces inusitatus TaxID=68221 RepID=A0A918Q766_9ACTN|nr:hypothetical protein GCM10010387_33060 [Streptomyces inusitatus]
MPLHRGALVRRRFLAALSAAAGLVLLLPAAPAQALPGTGPHTITVDHSGKCLGLERDSGDDWVRLVTAACDGSARQRFTLAVAANFPNTYQFRTSYGKCLFMIPEDKMAVAQYPCRNTTNDTVYLIRYRPWPGEQIRYFSGNGMLLSAFCWHVKDVWTGDARPSSPASATRPARVRATTPSRTWLPPAVIDERMESDALGSQGLPVAGRSGRRGVRVGRWARPGSGFTPPGPCRRGPPAGPGCVVTSRCHSVTS